MILNFENMNYYTHSGFFHADEVFGFAICFHAGLCNNVVRVTDLNSIPQDGVIADIGREYKPLDRKFDHHQGFFTRPDGYPIASAGMLWDEYGVDVLSSFSDQPEEIAAIWQRVDETLFKGIDAHDSDNAYLIESSCSAGKVRSLSISNVIAMMNGSDPSDHETQLEAFVNAVRLASDVLIKSIYSALDYIKAKNKFAQVAQLEGSVIILSEGLPWKEIVHESHQDAMFVISPSNHPGNPYSMVAVPVDPEKREIKKAIERPDWFTGFIHQGKWIAGGESVEQLKKLALFNLD